MKMKKKLFSLLCILVPLCSFSQLIVDYSTGNKTNNSDDAVEMQFPEDMKYECIYSGDGYTIYDARSKKAALSSKASAEMYNVTFVYKYNSNVAAPVSLTVYNPQQGVIAVDKSGKSATFTAQVPKGVYDMHAMFKGKPTGSYVIFKENINIDKDTTLTFDKDEATIPISFKVYDENGTQLSLDKYEGSTVGEKGNVNSYRSYTFFALKGMGVVHTIIGGSYRVKGYDIDYYVNPVSDRFTLLHTCNMRSIVNNQTYYFKFQTVLDKPVALESKPADLITYTQKFIPTAAGVAEPSSHIYGNRVWCTYNGEVLLSGKSENKNIILENNENVFHVDLSKPIDGGFAVMVSPMMGDTYTASNKQYRHIVGLPVIGNANEDLTFVDYGYDILDGFVIPVGGGNAIAYPGNPALSWRGYKSNYVYGNCCPLLSIKAKDYNGNSTKLLTFLGRYGEIFETDKVTVTKSQQSSGDFIDETFTQENVKVDSLDGKNVTVVHRWAKGDDITAPSIQMLRFVSRQAAADNDEETPNLSQVITDRLNARDGWLELVAGDMQYHYDQSSASKRYYECKPISSIKVSCAKHGTDAWIDLTAKEIPEKFFMPGFGYFYEASLASLNEVETWYDLRVVLTDVASNSQTQTISPAFFLKTDNTGVRQPNCDNDGIILRNGQVSINTSSQILVLSLDGKIVRTFFGRELNIADLNKGVYVVKATTEDGKILVKKVII